MLPIDIPIDTLLDYTIKILFNNQEGNELATKINSIFMEKYTLFELMQMSKALEDKLKAIHDPSPNT